MSLIVLDTWQRLNKYMMSGIIPILMDFTGNYPWTLKGRIVWKRIFDNGIYFLKKIFFGKGLAMTVYYLFCEPQGFACQFKLAVLQTNFICRLPAPKSSLVSELSSIYRRSIVTLQQRNIPHTARVNSHRLDVWYIFIFCIKDHIRFI